MDDIIIIGKDWSSLAAALCSVRSGQKTVLILEGDARAADPEGGYLFPLDPRPHAGLADHPVLSPCFRDWPAHATCEPEAAAPLDPAFQVILPGHRLDIFRDPRRQIDELAREFPGQRPAIERFYRAVEKGARIVEQRLREEVTGNVSKTVSLLRDLVRFPMGWLVRSSLAWPGGPAAHPLRRALQAQWRFLSHLAIDDERLPLCAAYLLSLPSRGLFYPRCGEDTPMLRFRRAFAEAGGTICEGGAVIRIETGSEILVDLEIGGAASTVRGRKLIVSAQWEKRELLLPTRQGRRPSPRRPAAIRPSGYPFHLHLGVRETGLPEKLAPYAVVVRDGPGPVEDRELVFLETSLSGENGRAPAGRRALTATVFLPDSPLRMSDQELKQSAMETIDSLEGFLPFLRESIDYLHLDRSIARSRDSQETAPRKHRTARPPFWGTRTLGNGTRIPNVLLTGAITRAGLGFEGEIIAGTDTAAKAGREA